MAEVFSARQIKESARKSYQGTIERNIKDWLKRPITEITLSTVISSYQAIRDDVAKRGKQKQLANPSGEAEAQKAIRSLSAILGFYEEDVLP